MEFQRFLHIKINIALGKGNYNARLAEENIDAKPHPAYNETWLYDAANIYPEVSFKDCLRQIYRRLQGYTIWLYVDRAQWHRGKEVDFFVQTHTRLRLEYLPAYQPGLNVQERVWRQTRYEATTNRWFESLDMIWDAVQNTTQSWMSDKLKRLCKIN